MPLRLTRLLLHAAALPCLLAAGNAGAARVEPGLAMELQRMAPTERVPVLVTFRGEGPPDARNAALLSGHGLAAAALQALPMAAVQATPAQVAALADEPQVRSVWRDRMTTVPDDHGDPIPTLPAPDPWSGRGIGVLLATAADPEAAATGLERIAPGAEVVGFRPGSGSTLTAALGAFDHALLHQFDHNLRVVWNPLAVLDQAARLDPDHPLQVALRALAERGVLAVVPAVDGGAAVPWALAAAGPADGPAPALCGVLALMLEANPALTWRQAREILHPLRLAGALDAHAAVRAAAGGSSAGGSGRSRETPGLMSSFGDSRH